MNFLKYIYVAVLFLNIPLFAAQDPVKQKSDDTFLEWVEITPQNISTPAMEAFFKQLEPIYISAFTELEKASMQEEYPEKYQAMVAKGETMEKALAEEWKEFPHQLNVGFAQGLEKVPCAIIKNKQNDILGFSFFILLGQKILLPILRKMGFFNEINWIKENKEETSTDNEVYVRLLAVKPDCQKHGLGKKLVFSILSHFPQFKKIYLITRGSKSNKKTQKFYAHRGFEYTANYINENEGLWRIYEFDSK